MPLTHEELSFLVGAHRVSITKAIKGLKEAGKLSQKREKPYSYNPGIKTDTAHLLFDNHYLNIHHIRPRWTCDVKLVCFFEEVI
ncbi:helix-turn-helix domain-containing protein [Dissulfurispira thermophila]|uniref:helix-turn-helix domain-containing protein n=1 Tax=Dissulfurispira thermophila TaxID=2715679 RepID=UPI003BEEB5EB